MRTVLTEVITSALAPLFETWGLPNPTVELQVPPDPAKGDFALNTAMKYAKLVKRPPIKLAQEMAERLSGTGEWFASVEAAPPGFLNLKLKETAIAKVLTGFSTDPDAALKRAGPQKTVVLDYSSVNIAKQMHVGHLRSTIIGDVLTRVLVARGDKVIRQNHLGDWGVPMALVIWKTAPEIRECEAAGRKLEEELTLTKLETLYKEATRAAEQDPSVAEAARQVLVRLQGGETGLLEDWRKITRVSMAEVYRIYQRLGVLLTPEDEAGESFYRDRLAETVQAVKDSGKAVESRGAQCVFLEQFKAKDGSPLPVIIQKSDGGFNYETFDLAAIRYRINTLGAHRVIYVTDARQGLHFAQVFEVAKVCGWTDRAGTKVDLEHVPFGTILGEDGKPFKTRSGENVKLSDLLNEAVERAYSVVKEKNAQLSEERKQAVAAAVGIGAVKYADLSQNRNNDYVFSFDRMLALNGNTAPYLQYAHARICSIFRKAEREGKGKGGPIVLGSPAERALALRLLDFPVVVAAVSQELRPHSLCNFLYELATAFSTFYDQCPVMGCDDPSTQASRFSLCDITRRILARGLGLMGIEAPEEM